MKNSYIVTLLKFILSLIFVCFLIELGKEFWRAIRAEEGFNESVFYLAILFSFMFYTFIADLNNLYGKVQRFFFRSSFVSFLFPAALIIVGAAYFFLPRVANFSFDKNVFVFLGGFIVTSHLTFVARENKGHSFSAFINYLFVLCILCIITMILFGVYLTVAFKIHVGAIIVQGVKESFILISSLCRQIYS